MSRRYRRNAILHGEAEGKPHRFRGYATKYKIWKYLDDADDYVSIDELVSACNSLTVHQVKTWIDIWFSKNYIKRKEANYEDDLKDPFAYKLALTKKRTYEKMLLLDMYGEVQPPEIKQVVWNHITSHPTDEKFDIHILHDAVDAQLGEVACTRTRQSIADYLRYLFKAGYLRQDRLNKRKVSYSLECNTGGIAPSVLRFGTKKKVYDSNLELIVKDL